MNKPEPKQIHIYNADSEEYALCVEVHDDILRHFIHDADIWNAKQQHGDYAIVGIVSRLFDFESVIAWVKSLTIDDVPAEFMEHHNHGADRQERLMRSRKGFLNNILFGEDNMEGDDDEPTE